MSDIIDPTEGQREVLTRIENALRASVFELLEAARLFARAIDQFGDSFLETVMEHGRGITPNLCRRLESIGRGTMDVRLFYVFNEAGRRLGRLPPPTQADALSKGIKVLAADGSHLLVSVEQMTPQQAQMAFDFDHIRTLEEQRSWLETQRIRPAIEVSGESWRVRNGVVEVIKPTALTESDLRKALRALRGK